MKSYLVVYYSLHKDLYDNIVLFYILPAVRISSGCVAESEESVVNERQQQAPLATVKTTRYVIIWGKPTFFVLITKIITLIINFIQHFSKHW